MQAAKNELKLGKAGIVSTGKRVAAWPRCEYLEKMVIEKCAFVHFSIGLEAKNSENGFRISEY